MLNRQAFRISFNRIVAGVHFPVDMAAGAVLGVALGEYMVGMCETLPYVAGEDSFKRATSPTHDVQMTLKMFSDTRYGDPKGKINSVDFLKIYDDARVVFTLAEAPVLSALWTAAGKEWRYRA